MKYLKKRICIILLVRLSSNTFHTVLSKNEAVISIEKKIGIEFYNIESFLMVYSSSDLLNLTENDLQEMRNLMRLLSDELILRQYP